MLLFINVGSRNELKESSGISHFVEHMLFKGTERRPTPKDVSGAIESVGGLLNAEAGKELTVYWAKVVRSHLPLALDVLADIIRHSRFDPLEIEKERRVITEELNMLFDTPYEWVDILFDEILWGDQPLGRNIAGTKQTVATLTRETLLTYMEQHYSPSSAVVSIVGAIDHQEVVDRVASLLSDWEPGPNPSCSPVLLEMRGPLVHAQSKRTEQAHLCLGTRGLSYAHPDRFTLGLLNVLLGEGMSSRLFQEIREKRGLAYDVHSYVHHYRDAGCVGVYAGVDPKRIEAAVEAIMTEIKKIARDGVAEEELRTAKEFWKGRMLLGMEDTRSLAAWIGSQEILLGRILTLNDVIGIIDSTTTTDIQRVAHRIFDEQEFRLAVVGPFGPHIEQRLQRLL